VEIENTHNMAGGTVYSRECIDEICDGAHECGVKVHMDGARIFNAAAACGESVATLTAKCDTVMFCLSKGLGAPSGSMLVGTREDIARARLYRKRLGGGMRQVGILAAAGLIALEKMPARLAEDHANARRMAEGLARIPGIEIEPEQVRTNIVIYDISGTGRTSAQISARLKERGVLINGINPKCMRLVTHMDVSTADCESALGAIEEAVKR
jgi:threonine aldolase